MKLQKTFFLTLPRTATIKFFKIKTTFYTFLIIKGIIGTLCIVFNFNFLKKNKLLFILKKSLTDEKKKKLIDLNNFLIIKGIILKLFIFFNFNFLKKKKLLFIFKKSLTNEKKKNVIGLDYLLLILLKNAQFGYSSILFIKGVGYTFFFNNKNLGLD